ncbi:MAG: hypothetical protein KHW87_09460 [Clostridiales bacterium]|nr:hypothetical protein [Clostridiales bacterium]
MDKIVPAFETTLFDPTLSDACIDMAELGIDSLLDEGVFKSIPIVSVLVGLGKTAQNIHDRNLLKQTIKFINTFNEKSISAQKIEKYKNHLDSNPKYAEEELGRVIILLNSNVDLKKSELLAKFYRSYVNGDIDWSTFCELADITSRLFISDLHLLFEVSKGRVSDTSQCQTYKADRLIALGLLDSAMKSMSIGSLSGSQTQRFIQANNLGKLFCKIAQQ